MNTSHSLQITVIYNPEDKTQTEEIAVTDEGIEQTAETIADSLRLCGYETQTYAVSEKNLYYLKHKKTDAFFNVCEGADIHMKVIKQLEKYGKVFTGPGPQVMKLTTNKIASKKVFENIGISTPQWQFFVTGKEKLDPNLSFPLIVKPTNEDCSIGITQSSIAVNEESLYEHIQRVCETYKHGALVEEFILGRELHCTVVGNGDEAIALPLAELQFIDGHTDDQFIFDYEAKWIENSPRNNYTFISPAPSVDDSTAHIIQSEAKRAFLALNMKDYARFDIRYNMESKMWYFLEANANPSIQNATNEATVISASASGMRYHEFIQSIVESCTQRHLCQV